MDSGHEQLSKLRALDDAAWQLLDKRLRRRLLGFFRRRIGTTLETDLDLVQETLILATRRIETYDPGKGSLDSWIFGIANNLYRSWARASSRRRTEISIETFVELLERGSDDYIDAAEMSELNADIVWALIHLTELQRSVFLAFEESGHTLAEIASVHNCTISAIKSALHAARKNLRKHLTTRNPDLAADQGVVSITPTHSRRVRR